MKTRKYIKLLATTVIALALCACGGGGGGGGESDGNHSGHQSTEQAFAPTSLSAGDILTLTYPGEEVRIKILTSTTLSIGDATVPYTYKYLSANSARITINDDGEEIDLQLNYSSPTRGNGDDGEDPFTFTLTRANTGNSANAGTSSGSSTVSGYAPTTLNGYYIAFNSTVNGIQKIGFSGNTVTISPANVSGTYSYTRSGSNGNEGSVTLNCSGSNYDSNGTMTLTFHSAGSVTLKGKINGSTYTLTGSFAKGKVEISGGSSGGSTATGTAPSSLAGLEIQSSSKGEFLRFVNGTTVEQGKLGTTSAWGSGSYTYNKTSGSTGTLKYNISGTNGNWTEHTDGVLELTFSTSGTITVKGYVVLNSESDYVNRTDTLTTASGGSSSGGNTSGGSSSSQSYAPSSLEGKVLSISSSIGSIQNAQHFGFSGGKVTIMPAAITGTYRYSKSSANGNNATLTIDCDGTRFDTDSSGLKLTFTSSSSGSLSGKFGMSEGMTTSFSLQTGTLNTGGATNTGGYPTSLAVGTQIKFSTSINIFRANCNCSSVCDECKNSIVKITGTNTATITSNTGKYKLNGTYSYIPGTNGEAILNFYSSSNTQSANYPMLYSSTAATGGTLNGYVTTTQSDGSTKMSYKGSFTVTKP